MSQNAETGVRRGVVGEFKTLFCCYFLLWEGCCQLL